MKTKLRIGMVVHAHYLRDARVIRYPEALAQEGHGFRRLPAIARRTHDRNHQSGGYSPRPF